MSTLIQEFFKPELAFLRNAVLLGFLAGPVLGVIGSMVVRRQRTHRSRGCRHRHFPAARGGHFLVYR